MDFYENLYLVWVSLRICILYGFLWELVSYMDFYENLYLKWISMRACILYGFLWEFVSYMDFYENLYLEWISMRTCILYGFLWQLVSSMDFYENLYLKWLSIRACYLIWISLRTCILNGFLKVVEEKIYVWNDEKGKIKQVYGILNWIYKHTHTPICAIEDVTFVIELTHLHTKYGIVFRLKYNTLTITFTIL